MHATTDGDDRAATLAAWTSRGPRYTSYPPATEFGPLAAGRVLHELQHLGGGTAPISLYLHVPFCRSLCAYCGCNVVPTRDPARGIGYVDQLVTEMAVIAAGGFTAPVREVVLGGGSPNFLAPSSMGVLLGAVARYFAVEPDARRSIELDPRTTTSAQLATLGDLGFKSMSMGVQDFARGVQDAIRRHQTVQQTRWLVDEGRAYGFDDINIDIVYGLPRQTETSFAETLDQVIALAPDRVALFGYAHLPDKLPAQRLVERAGRVLDAYERATLLLLGIEKFAQAGYVHLGLDHFARPGSRLARAAAERRMVRTFQGYVERQADAIIGVGTSAISSTPRMHWQNHAELPVWEKAIAAGHLPVERGVILDDDDRARAALIDRLMCDGEVDLGELGAAHALDAETCFARELGSLDAVAPLASYDAPSRTLRTTELGRLLVRNVCRVFDRYRHDQEHHRFSSTI